jgi:membrane protein DedA with SNARE-associated domain
MRLVLLILGIFTFLLVGFLLLGEASFFDPRQTLDLFDRWRAWSVPIGLALMTADLLLPVPSSAIMNWYGSTWAESLGTAGGTVVGGLVGAAVCVASSLLIYGLCRWLGRRAAVRLAGERDLERVRGFFERWGSLTIVATRPVPMLAEAVVCLAGMSRMPLGRFLLASTVGAIPFAMVFAWLGAMGRETEEPLSMLVLSIAIPLLLWVPVVWLLARRAGGKPVDDTP